MLECALILMRKTLASTILSLILAGFPVVAGILKINLFWEF